MRLLLLCVFLWVGYIQAAIIPKPAFTDLYCDEYQKNFVDPDAPQGVRLHWVTANADHVIVTGLNKPQPNSGIIEGPGIWGVTAIGPGGAAYKPIVCMLKMNSSTRPATAYHISHELMFLPNPSLKETLLTKHSLKEIRNTIIQILQTMSFPATEDPAVAVKNNLYIYTPEFVSIKSIGDERIEREVAFQILVRPDESGVQDTYEVQILTAVLRRFRMEGGDFEPDPEATKQGMPIAELLFKSLRAAL